MLEVNLVDDVGLHTDENCVHAIVNKSCEIFIPLDSILDKEKERIRIGNQIKKLSKDIQVLKSRLNNENFAMKAPRHLVAESTHVLREHEELLQALKRGLADLEH